MAANVAGSTAGSMAGSTADWGRENQAQELAGCRMVTRPAGVESAIDTELFRRISEMVSRGARPSGIPKVGRW